MREPRIYLEGATHYITVRAGTGELLFREDTDYAYFLNILKERKEKYNFKLYAFCLLPQHYHLLIETKDKNISKIMQAINTSYSLYFNNKYNRQGHLLAGRFQMKVVNKDASLLELTYHMHLNPKRCGLANMPEEYRFSSYQEYTTDVNNPLTDYADILAYLGPTEDKQVCLSGRQALQTRYRELIQEDIVTSSQTEEIISPKKFRLRTLVGVGSGLLIVIGLIFFVLRIGGFKEAPDTRQVNRELSAQKKNALSLPEGLPAVETIQLDKKQVWEFWKM